VVIYLAQRPGVLNGSWPATRIVFVDQQTIDPILQLKASILLAIAVGIFPVDQLEKSYAVLINLGRRASLLREQ
jgi:exo-beta-1,3-glucanase (GH17 family)